MVTTAPIGRRAAMLGALSVCAAPLIGRGAEPLRLAAIDWAMMETAIALGHMPVAACELIRYREDAVAPNIPLSVTDLGLRGSPNFELLQLTRPDLILSSNYYTGIEPRLAAIAPVMAQPFYLPGEAPWPKAVAALHALADRLGNPGTATRTEARARATLAELSTRLDPLKTRPVYVIEIGDARHFRAFGADSMFGNILTELGFENAWTDLSRFAFAAPVPLERLAERPEARIVLVSGIPPIAARALETSVLWTHLEPVAEGRASTLGAVNPFGGIPAALRFAELLASALTGAA
ncbi:iron-siderophore ABC transporter substrate-binding protein [Paracoccaceae bacterium GXU_MW_L88]